MVHDRRKTDNWDKVFNNVELSIDRKISSLDEEEDIEDFEGDEGTAIVKGDSPTEQLTPFAPRNMMIVVTSVLLSLILLGLLLVLLRGT